MILFKSSSILCRNNDDSFIKGDKSQLKVVLVNEIKRFDCKKQFANFETQRHKSQRWSLIPRGGVGYENRALIVLCEPEKTCMFSHDCGVTIPTTITVQSIGGWQYYYYTTPQILPFVPGILRVIDYPTQRTSNTESLTDDGRALHLLGCLHRLR